MKLTESIPSLRGALCFRVVRSGRVEHSEFLRNLIVTRGRNNLARLLSGGSGMHVTHIGVGTGASDATMTDAALTNPVLTAVSEARVGTNLEDEQGGRFDDQRTVQFHFRVPRDAAVGMELREYGLLCADGSLFSRIVRPSGFVKTDLDMIVGFWEIQF